MEKPAQPPTAELTLGSVPGYTCVVMLPVDGTIRRDPGTVMSLGGTPRDCHMDAGAGCACISARPGEANGDSGLKERSATMSNTPQPHGDSPPRVVPTPGSPLPDALHQPD